MCLSFLLINIINTIKMKIILAFVFALCVMSDVISRVPGYPRSYLPDSYGGYLQTSSINRKLHYVFLGSQAAQNNTDPLTLWLNGGPGCSSKLGFIQQIGPYFLEINTDYNQGDNLTQNKYSWTYFSNILFLDSPAGVGYSINNDPDYIYNDQNTAKDTLDALISFFSKDQFAPYIGRDFYIAGESYAGKYIPDLAVLIDRYNRNNPDNKINLKGILVGNGVMSFTGGSLGLSQMQFMLQHEFIDPQLLHYWTYSCAFDPQSAGCQYYESRYDDLVGNINPYNVYGNCYPNPSASQNKLNQRTALTKKLKTNSKKPNKNNSYGIGCDFDYGIEKYFDINYDIFYSTINQYVVCNGTINSNYAITESGSLQSYKYLLDQGIYKITLFNGDWDDVVPFRDTYKNLKLLNLQPQGEYTNWIVGGQHAGFQRQYPGLKFVLVKGAGHEVPQYQRQRAFQLFRSFIKD